MNVISGLLDTMTILEIDKDTASSYALIKSQLYADSYTLPENDIWIAAIAHQHNLSVATFDRHFEFVAAINVISS
jgi:tRNA(fMet)-specific endonuclease VapC